MANPFSKLPNLSKGKPYIWLATNLTQTLQTDPQHWGLFLLKGKPYLWLANPPIDRDKPTDPQPRVKVKIHGANGVVGHGGTLTKYLL